MGESYKSLNEALFSGGVHNDAKVRLKFIDSERIQKAGIGNEFSDVDGILVPGGFGSRGIEGKILAVQYARENRIPYFGICLGMQMAVVRSEFHGIRPEHALPGDRYNGRAALHH